MTRLMVLQCYLVDLLHKDNTLLKWIYVLAITANVWHDGYNMHSLVVVVVVVYASRFFPRIECMEMEIDIRNVSDCPLTERDRVISKRSGYLVSIIGKNYQIHYQHIRIGTCGISG